MTIRKAITIGSSVGVTIPKELLKKRNIVVGDELEVESTSSGILIKPRPKRGNRREKITKLTMDFVERYRDDLEALSDR